MAYMLNLRMSEEWEEWLVAKAKATSTSRNAVVMMALDFYRKQDDASRMMPEMLAMFSTMQKTGIIPIPSSK